MKIYHYTSIENLALILKHKTLRFNRLDMMEDLYEKTFLMNQFDWSPYTYVSCWTENPVENVPLWDFYTHGKGIRIGIDKDFIDWDKQSVAFSAPARMRHHRSLSKDSSGSVSITFNPIRLYRPLTTETCYNKVKYASEAEYHEFENNIARKKSYLEIDEGMMRQYVGVFRKDKWAFQDESRFVIYAVPYTSTDAVVSHNDFVNLIRMAMPNKVPYIDVPIKPEKLHNIEVTLGPRMEEGQTILTKALLNKYAPDAKLRISSLCDSPFQFKV